MEREVSPGLVLLCSSETNETYFLANLNILPSCSQRRKLNPYIGFFVISIPIDLFPNVLSFCFSQTFDKSLRRLEQQIFFIRILKSIHRSGFHTVHTFIHPFAEHSCFLIALRSVEGLLGVPTGIRNSDLPYSKPTHYYLSCAAPWIFIRIVVCF
jgi:hypothetical protein